MYIFFLYRISCVSELVRYDWQFRSTGYNEKPINFSFASEKTRPGCDPSSRKLLAQVHVNGKENTFFFKYDINKVKKFSSDSRLGNPQRRCRGPNTPRARNVKVSNYDVPERAMLREGEWTRAECVPA